MYRDSYQRGMLTVFFSGGSKPLEIWDTLTRDGYVQRFLDPEIKSMVLEICGSNVSTTYMICPKGRQVLGITMPFLVMIVKNLKKYFSFEVTILDDTGTRRRFRVSNFQSTTQIAPLCTVMPIALSAGWNQIQFNLAEFTRRAYKKQFVEVQKLKINANIRLRRIYFAERLIPESELPPEYKLYFPLQGKPKVKKTIEEDKDRIDAAAPPVEKKDSKIEVIKPVPSKTSVTSIKKSSKQSLPKEGAKEGSKEASVADEAKATKEVKPDEVPESTLPTDATMEGDLTPLTGERGEELVEDKDSEKKPSIGSADKKSGEGEQTAEEAAPEN